MDPPALGNLRLPPIELTSHSPSKRWLAMSTDPTLDCEIADASATESTANEFLAKWGDADANDPPQSVLSNFDSRRASNLAIRPRETEPIVDESLNVSAGLTALRVELRSNNNARNPRRIPNRVVCSRESVDQRNHGHRRRSANTGALESDCQEPSQCFLRSTNNQTVSTCSGRNDARRCERQRRLCPTFPHWPQKTQLKRFACTATTMSTSTSKDFPPRPIPKRNRPARLRRNGPYVRSPLAIWKAAPRPLAISRQAKQIQDCRRFAYHPLPRKRRLVGQLPLPTHRRRRRFGHLATANCQTTAPARSMSNLHSQSRPNSNLSTTKPASCPSVSQHRSPKAAASTCEFARRSSRPTGTRVSVPAIALESLASGHRYISRARFCRFAG